MGADADLVRRNFVVVTACDGANKHQTDKHGHDPTRTRAVCDDFRHSFFFNDNRSSCIGDGGEGKGQMLAAILVINSESNAYR